MNYELLGYQYQSSGQSEHYIAANTELGLNAGDWIIRNRQVIPSRMGWENFKCSIPRPKPQ
ncbi:hypothetical protein EMIT0P265_180021 [Pseudomonas zeae]